MSSFPTFANFYRDIYDRDPFPWQEALAERVAEQGWPEAVTVPTGLGKTVVLVVGVWELARQIHAGGARSAPLRILHVVDRTAIVDQTHRDIITLHTALDAAHGTVSSAGVVSTVLSERFGAALVTGKVHGTHRDTEWVSAHQPVVATMTAHQAVSRVLFRGFGVSTGMAPVHAATVGMDSLVVVDEPHLSSAAVDTLRRVKQLQNDAESVGVPVGSVVALGATLPSLPERTLGITSADRDHPVAGQRLDAVKTLTQHTTDKATAAQVKAALIRVAKQELAERPDTTVAVVCNTVDMARAVHTALTTGRGSVSPKEAVLVTGRVRGYERRGLDETLADPAGLRLMVATQTIEAGLDVSAATLVTEICGWQAFIQRLGRLNRYGLETGRAHVITTVRGETHHVYGDTAEPTAAVLATLPEQADVSPAGLENIAAQQPDLVQAATGTPPVSPTLTRSLLPTVSQTKPRPAADVTVQPFITGIRDESRVADVQVLWRHHYTADVLSAMPPSPVETVTVPMVAVRQLLANRLHNTSPFALLADAAASDAGTTGSTWTTTTPVGSVHSGSGWQPLTSSREITPGATIALDPGWGGHDDTGWNPTSYIPVTDLSAFLACATGRWWLADEYSLAALHTLGALATVPDRSVWESFTLETDPEDVADLVTSLLPAELHEQTPGAITDRGVWLRTAPARTDPVGIVTLVDHAAHVAHLAHTWAERLQLPQPLTTTLAAAAYHHDDGKSEDAFQTALGATPDFGPLAKQHPAGPGPTGGITPGWRHESLSAQLARDHGHDDLTVHLIAAHHGWARPLLPPADGPGQNSPTDQAFRRYTDQYGPWGLAWLETFVRLADHHASAQPESGHTPPTVAPRGRTPKPQRPEQSTLELTGLVLHSHMAWWAAAGALAAANLADPESGLHFTDGQHGLIPALTSTMDLPSLAAHVVSLREQAMDLSRTRVGLTTKFEKVPAEHVRTTLAELDTLPETQAHIAAAVLDDTQPAQHDGKLSLRVPWHNTNSNLLGKIHSIRHTPDAIAEALLHDTPEQRDAQGHYGLTPATEAASPLITGITDDTRSVLLPLVWAAAACLPSTGGPRATGTTTRRTRQVPLPTTPTTWGRLVTLLQTLPQQPNAPWHHLGVDSRTYTETSSNNGKAKAWTHS